MVEGKSKQILVRTLKAYG